MAKTIVDQILQSLAFELEAVPQNDSAKSTSTSNNTPLNLKIRVRKTDAGVLENAVLSVPKFGPPYAKPRRFKLVSSDQTIMSFNVSMEADLIKKPKRKPRRYFFGGCLGTQYDDEDSPYVPTVYSAKTNDRDSTSKSDGILKQNFVLSKAKYNNTDSLQTYTKRYDILGKCKPGGCLDPPFGEEKYSYEPLKRTKRQVSTTIARAETTLYNQNHLLSSSFESKRTKVNLSVQKPNAKIEDDSILSLDETNSLKDTLVSKYPDSVITYPPETSSSIIASNNKYLRTRVTSEEKQRKTLNESIPLETFFPSPKKHNRFIEKHVNGKNFCKNGKSKADEIPSITVKDNIDKKEGDVKPDKLSEITSSIEQKDFTATETSSQQELLGSNIIDSQTNKTIVTAIITKLSIDKKEDIAVLSKNEISTSDQEVDLRSSNEISSVMKTVCDNDTTLQDLYLNSAIYAKSDDTIAISLTPETKNTASNNDVSSAKDIFPRKIHLKSETDELKNNFPITTSTSKNYSDVNNLKDTIEKDSSFTSLITQTSDNDIAINKNTSLSTQRVRTSPKTSKIKTNFSINADASQINLNSHDDENYLKFNNVTSVVIDQTKEDIEENWLKKLEYNDNNNNSLKDSDICLLSEKVLYETNISNFKKYLSAIHAPTDVVQGKKASECQTPTDNISHYVDPIKDTIATTEGIHDIDTLNKQNVSSSLQDYVTTPNDSNVVPVFPNVKDTDDLKNKVISALIYDVESLPLAINAIPVAPIENTKIDKAIKPKESNISTKPQSKTSLDEPNIPGSEDFVFTAEPGEDSSHITATSVYHMKREYSSKPEQKITDEKSDVLLNQNITQPFDDITSRLNNNITKKYDFVLRESKYQSDNLQGEQDVNNTGCKNSDNENQNKHIELNRSANSQYNMQDNRSLKNSNSHAFNEKAQYEKKTSNSLLNFESTIQTPTDVIQNSNGDCDLFLNNVTITNSKYNKINGNVPENVYFGSYLEPISLRDDDPKVKLIFPENSIEYNNNTIDNSVTVDGDKVDDHSFTQKTITKDTSRMGFNKESIEYINSSHKNENNYLQPNTVKSPNFSENYNIELLKNSKIVNDNAEIGHKPKIKGRTDRNHEFMNSPLYLRQPVREKLNSSDDKTILQTLPGLETITSGWDSQEGTHPTVRGSKSSLKRDAIRLEFAFQSYVTDKKERTIKTFDIFNEPVRYPNDAVTVIQALIRPLVNEIRIPVDSEYDLTIEIKRASSPTRSVQVIEEHQSGKLARKKMENIPKMEKDYDNLINLDSCSGINIKEMQDEFLSNTIQKRLNAIYDQQLMPLHSMIINLKQDIDLLNQQQTGLEKKVRKGKTSKPPRLVRVSSRCGCSRK